MVDDTVFRFLDLPAELRNNIYEKAFDGNTIHANDVLKTTKRKVSPPALLMACKQIYNEALDIFWSSTCVSLEARELETADDFSLLPSSRQSYVKRVVVDITAACQTCVGLMTHFGRPVRKDSHEKYREAYEGSMATLGAEELASKLQIVCQSEACPCAQS